MSGQSTYKMTMALLIFMSAVSDAQKHFLGASMSLTFLNTSDNQTAQVTLVSGWRLGQGPCGPSCNPQQEGKSTGQTRSEVLLAHSADYLGDWFIERDRHATYLSTQVTADVNRDIHGVVAAVNPSSASSQEITVFNVKLGSLGDRSSVQLQGDSQLDIQLSQCRADDQTHRVNYTMRVHAEIYIRNDTGKPNNSPRALFKPMYQVPIDTETRIKIPALDPDGDYVRCRDARYIELGGCREPHNTTILPSCEVVIRPFAQDGVKVGDVGIVKVKAGDFLNYPVQLLTAENRTLTQKANREVTSIPVQFMYEIVQSSFAPTFESPPFCLASSSADLSEILIYIGAMLEIPFTASVHHLSAPGTSIEKFRVTSLPYQHHQMTVLQVVVGKEAEGVRSSKLTWEVKSADAGYHLVQVVAIDSRGFVVYSHHGFESADCGIKIHVKHVNSSVGQTQPNDKPFFVGIPVAGSIRCTVGSKCVFPVFASTRETGSHIAFMQTLDDGTDPGVVHEYNWIGRVPDADQNIAQLGVILTSDNWGPKNVCVQAIDSKGHTIKGCLEVRFLVPNPCENSLCVERQGECIRNGTESPYYYCHCIGMGFKGNHCETALAAMQQTTCLEMSCNKTSDRCSSLTSSSDVCACNVSINPAVCDQGMYAIIILAVVYLCLGSVLVWQFS